MFKVILTSLLSVAVLFVIAKIIGHKQISQLDFFDYISGITIGSIAAELATELEQPLKPLIATVVYGVISVSLGVITHKFPKTRKFINGSPTILFSDGKLYRKNMKKAKIDLSEFMVLCREQGYFNLSQIKTAIFEQNGRLSIFPASATRPLTPSDVKIPVTPEEISVEIIMDGRILDGNLRRMNKTSEWLYNELKAQGYSSPRQIFLGTYNSQDGMVLYPSE